MCRHWNMSLSALLNHWDAGHYSNIIREGYAGERWAFMPLYPLFIKGITAATGTLAYPQFVGSLVSTLLLIAFIFAVELRAPRTEGVVGLAPRTPWGWFLFLYGPASDVFHSHHTESLFLVVTFFAYSFAATGNSVGSGLFAGLSLWARIQGLLVAPTAAWLAFGVDTKKVGLRRFAVIGAIAAAFCAGLLFFEYAGSGDPLAFVTAHQGWTHAHSGMEVLRTFWIGNPWQGVDRVSISRELFFFGWIAVGILLTRRQAPIGAYCLLSAAFLPLQAELINAFRYEASLFPLAFFAGDWLAARPWWLRWASVPALIAVNHWVALSYAKMGWAY
jgi:hypothetical protein